VNLGAGTTGRSNGLRRAKAAAAWQADNRQIVGDP
jgi:hypothetical protein